MKNEISVDFYHKICNIFAADLLKGKGNIYVNIHLNLFTKTETVLAEIRILLTTWSSDLGLILSTCMFPKWICYLNTIIIRRYFRYFPRVFIRVYDLE